MPVLLELFSGTHSVGRVARRRGWRVISIDNQPDFDPTYCEDILKWDYKQLRTKIDFVWASPPCTTYSIAATWYRHRDPHTGTPWTREAKEADRILRRTLAIIQHFRSRNPALRFCIENPRGYMRKKREMHGFHRTTTSYNQYGFPIAKPTDFWTNFALELHPPVRGGIAIGRDAGWMRKLAEHNGNYDQATLLGQVPPRLVGRILTQCAASSSRPRAPRRSDARARPGPRPSSGGSRARSPGR